MTREDIDDLWLGLIGSFHQCLPCAGEITAADSVGHVLVFFTDMLYYEAETSISDMKLREYLELLESLLISLLMDHTSRKSSRKSTSARESMIKLFESTRRLSPWSYILICVAGTLFAAFNQCFEFKPYLCPKMASSALETLLYLSSAVDFFFSLWL